ncbi:MAG TPA: hypothetical protein VGB54_05085 [Allosphingosinicella sp.]|jgi:cobalamin biosynthesis Mg chelatase CobN
MRLKALTAGIAAASLALSPVVAHAQTASAPTRAGAEMQEANGQDWEDSGTWIVGGIIVLAVALGFYFFVIEDEATSP